VEYWEAAVGRLLCQVWRNDDEAPSRAKVPESEAWMPGVVIVEDVPGLRRVLARILQDKGFTVFEAENGRRGLELVQAEAPSLVVTDMLMPDMDGLEMIRRLRQIDRDLKILAVSGSGPIGQQDLLDLASTFGADAVLRKPFRAADILSTIRGLLGPPAAGAEE
jgi:CheY-like chemotaxis protein